MSRQFLLLLFLTKYSWICCSICKNCSYCWKHSPKKRKYRLETPVLLLIFLLDLETSRVALQGIHQKSKKSLLSDMILAIFYRYDILPSSVAKKPAKSIKNFPRKRSNNWHMMCLIYSWSEIKIYRVSANQKWFSTGNVGIGLLENWRNNIDNINVVVALLIDLSKVYDLLVCILDHMVQKKIYILSLFKFKKLEAMGQNKKL